MAKKTKAELEQENKELRRELEDYKRKEKRASDLLRMQQLLKSHNMDLIIEIHDHGETTVIAFLYEGECIFRGTAPEMDTRDLTE